MFRLLLAALALVSATPAAAQELWLGGDASVSVAPRTKLSVESIARIGEDGLYEVEFGGMLAYDLGGVEVAAGYLRAPGYDRGTVTAVEDRTRQQIATSFGPVSARLRLEQRFLSNGSDMGLRLRPRVRLGLPLPGSGVSFVLSQESFIELNDTDWGQDAGLRRVRHFAGIKTPLMPGIDVEAGYLHQFNRGRRGAADSAEHVASVGLSLGF